MVNFNVKIDMAVVDKMLSNYPKKAAKEYTRALKNTIIHGHRIAPERTPGRGGVLKKSWRWEVKELNGSLYNISNYAGYVDQGWKRTRPILPKKPGGVLVFKTKKFKGSLRTSTKTMLKKRSMAMKRLSGKGLTQKQKNEIVTNKTGVVVTNKITKPARFRGYNFVGKRIYPSIKNRFSKEIALANERIFR